MSRGLLIAFLMAAAVTTYGGGALVTAAGGSKTPDSTLTTNDRQRFKSVFAEAARGEDAAAIAYAALGLKALGEPPADSAALCKRLQGDLEGQKGNLAVLAVLAQAGQALNCGLKAGAEVSGVLQKAAAGGESAADVHNGFAALAALKAKPDATAALKALTAALKKDDSLTNLGHALQLAALLDGVDVKAVADRAGDAFVQADEVDGRMLQFEGGLSATSLILKGAFQLAAKTKAAPPISKAQAVKFANYVLSRKSVQSAKGGVALLDALTVLSDNAFYVPVAVTLSDGSAVVHESSPKVRVRVTDLLGRALGSMSLVVDAATRASDGAVVLSKHKMTAVSGDATAHEVDLYAAKPGRGFYTLTVTATPTKADARLVGNEGVSLLVKALDSVAVTGAEIGVADVDQSTAPKLSPVQPPSKLASALTADHRRKVVFKFAIKDKTSNEKIRVHQAFVRLVHVATDAEIVFVAEPDSADTYHFDLDVGARTDDFGGRSGAYQLHLLVGDAVVANPVSWHVADVQLSFPEDSKASAEATSGVGPKPEIRHLFREPEKRPPPAVSTVFTALCVAPVLIMLIGWLKIGVNVSAFPWSLSALGFHLGLGAIFGLYYYFWLQLNMFTTVKYLFMVGVVTFLCGNGMLVAIAEKRKKADK